MKQKKNEPTAVSRRIKVVQHLLNNAEHTLKHSEDIEQQCEALECKKLLTKRLEEIEAEAFATAA